MLLVLLLCYPLCVHLAIVTQIPALQVLALFFLAVGVQYPALRRGSVLAWSGLLLLIVLSAWLAFQDLAKYVLYVPPILVPLLVWSGFVRTLMPGQVPLVTAIGQRVHGELPADIVHYTRRVTVLWAIVLGGLSLWAAALPWLGSALVWSWFSNFVNYALVALLFIAEFYYRRRRFPDFEQPSLRETIGIVYRSGVRSS